MSTLRTTNVIHGASAISNIVLDNQGRAIFGPNSPQGRAALYVNAQNNRVGVNTESPSVALDVAGAINATGNVAIGGTLDVTGNVSFDGTVTSNGNVNLLGTLSVGTSTSVGPLTVQSDSQSRAISILGRTSDGIGELTLFAANGTTQLARIQTRSTHVLFSSGNNTTGLSINQSTNYVGIGSNFSPSTRLSVQDGSLANGSILVGANYNGTGMNQNSDKLGAISFPMYQSDTYPQGFRGVMSYASNTVNFLQLGGGTNSARSATDIIFYTAPDIATNGTQAGRFDNTGRLLVNTPTTGRTLRGGIESGTAGVVGTTTTLDLSNSSVPGFLSILNGNNNADQVVGTWFNHGGLFAGIGASREVTNQWGTDLRFYTHKSQVADQYEVYERMRLAPDGYLGIGTTSPVARLSVVNNGQSGIELEPEITTNTNRITNFNRSTSSYCNFRLDAASLDFLIEGVEKFNIDANGRIRHAGGQNSNGGGANLGAGGYYRIAASRAIPPNATVDFVFSGLQSGWMTVRGGGYSSAGQSQFNVMYHLGGFMTSTGSYNIETIAEWGAGVTITMTKNGSNMTVRLVNGSGSYTLTTNWCIESSSSSLEINS